MFWMVLSACSDSPQRADQNFKPQNVERTFSQKNSPVVFVDEAHHNFLTVQGRYRPFSDVLESDGYSVKRGKRTFSLEYLQGADILVIANALDRKRTDWQPPYTQALSDEEVSSVKAWVLNGGSLFLIADHAPFPHVIKRLALEFGFEFSNGHVGNAVFSARDNTLTAHDITFAHKPPEYLLSLPTTLAELPETLSHSHRVNQVRSFGGSAFTVPPEGISLLTLATGTVSFEPDIPFNINANTRRVSVDGWSQGAVLEIEQGRIAVFSEGMMFSSQIDVKTGNKYGLTSEGAEQNERFLLNVMAWLAKAN